MSSAVGFFVPGGPEVLTVVDRPVREPGPGEVRIAVRAAAVNPTDVLFRESGGEDLTPPWIPGMDAAGVVEAIGQDVDRFAVGDAVMAAVTPRRPEGGAQIEQLVAPAASVVPIPENATLEQAATLPMNGITALHGLDLMGLEAGQTLAVTGGAGLLASYVIPLAKEAGLRVVADAKAEDEDLVRSFGADEIVPRGAGFVDGVRAVAPAGADGIFDTALLHEAAVGALRDGGQTVLVRGWMWSHQKTERDITVHEVMVGRDGVLTRTDWLEELRALASVGGLQLRVAAELPPEGAGEAHRLMESGGLRGRVVIVF